jgi:hypothetical protein
MKTRTSLMIISILLWGLFFISGCGDGVTEGTLNTTGAAVALTADPAGGMYAGQRCILKAALTDKSGTLLSKQQIFFSIPVNESGATLAAQSGITDSEGNAYTVYTAGSDHPGVPVQDTIQANIKEFSGFLIITRTGGSSPDFTITVVAAPPTLTADDSSSIITANVKNNVGSGTPVNGVTVTFTVTGGGSVSDPGTATTDGNGNAVITFTGGSGDPPKGRATGETDVVTASITVGGNTYTDAKLITYP